MMESLQHSCDFSCQQMLTQTVNYTVREHRTILKEWFFISQKITADGNFQGMNSQCYIYLHLTICCFVVNALISPLFLINILVVFLSKEMTTFTARQQIPKQQLQREMENCSLISQRSERNQINAKSMWKNRENHWTFSAV